MKFSRSLIVLALVTAAAVLIPLRRARAAFAPVAMAPGATPAPRGSLRRRVSAPRTLKRSQPGADRQDDRGASAAGRGSDARDCAAGRRGVDCARTSVHQAHAQDACDVGDFLPG